MIYLSTTRTMAHTSVHFHLPACQSLNYPHQPFVPAVSYLFGELNGVSVYGILLSEEFRETARAEIFHCNTLWRFHFQPLILHWQLSFSPPLKSHFQSLMAVMSLRSLDSYSKCHWHNGRQPLASFDHPCCVREQLELKHWGVWGVCVYVCVHCLCLCLAATLRQSSMTGNIKFTFK